MSPLGGAEWVEDESSHLSDVSRRALGELLLARWSQDRESEPSVAGIGFAVDPTASLEAVHDPERGVRSANLWVRSDGAQLSELVTKVDAGELKLHIAAHRSVDELAAVHEESGAGRLLGKTVVLAP